MQIKKHKWHKCETCGKLYDCPEPEDCDAPFEFGNCSESCKERHRKLWFYNLRGARQNIPAINRS